MIRMNPESHCVFRALVLLVAPLTCNLSVLLIDAMSMLVQGLDGGSVHVI
jgi:hypothetical protein